MAQLEFLKSEANAIHIKADGAYKTISEVSEELDIPQHVLRFWESHFPQVKPSRMRGSRRYYRPEDIDVLRRIKTLLYSQGYTIKGAKKMVRSHKELPAEAAPAPMSPSPAPMAAPTPVKAATITAMPDVPAILAELRALKNMLAPALR